MSAQTPYLRLALLLLVLSALIILLHPLAPNVTAQVNCVITKVGDPKTSPVLPPDCEGSGNQKSNNPNNPNTTVPGKVARPSEAANDIVKAAENLNAVYVACGKPPSTTFDNKAAPDPGIRDCMARELKSLGYSSDKIQAQESRRVDSALIEPYDKTRAFGPNCVQCLGFVGTVLALWSGNNTALTGYNAAGDVNNGNEFAAGNSTFRNVGTGNAAQVQPGDIAIAGGNGDPGHIGVVVEVFEDDTTKVRAVDSNFDLNCGVSDQSVYLKEKYQFWREQ